MNRPISFEGLLRIAGAANRAFMKEVGVELPVTAKEVIKALTDMLIEVENGNKELPPEQIVSFLFTITVLELIDEGG